MYSNVLYASWLNATYGLSESMPEAVPTRKMPPLVAFLPDPVAVAAKTANTTATTTSGSAASHLLLIFALPRLRTGTRPPSAFVRRRRAYNGHPAEWKPDASHARGATCREQGRRAVANVCRV